MDSIPVPLMNRWAVRAWGIDMVPAPASCQVQAGALTGVYPTWLAVSFPLQSSLNNSRCFVKLNYFSDLIEFWNTVGFPSVVSFISGQPGSDFAWVCDVFPQRSCGPLLLTVSSPASSIPAPGKDLLEARLWKLSSEQAESFATLGWVWGVQVVGCGGLQALC